MTGILGRKIGMTTVFDESGNSIPVTVIEAGPSFVLGAKTKERDGYTSLILGYGEKKISRTSIPQKKWFEKVKVSPKRFIREIRTDDPLTHKIGDKICVDLFKEGEYVDIVGTSIGKGFQGGIKRWHWRGGPKSHGSMFHRAPGSIGASSYPSRVFKGQHLPGRMGGERKTAQNLEIVTVDKEKNLLIIKGSVIGHKGGFLVIKQALKKPQQALSGSKEKKNEKTKE